MDAIPSELSGAARSADARLSRYARDVAVAGTSPGGAATTASMAGAARTAIFADALLSAMHARLEELKSVAK